MLVIASSKNNLKPGFNVVFKNESFKCAFITYSEAYSDKTVKEMKRHNTTDEIFILLKGEASIFIYEEGKKAEKIHMKKHKAYNITKNTWHHVTVSHDAELFVIENSNCSSENTEALYLSNENCLIE
ncbi:MAG: hypothetical protein J6D26_00640 [Clostridia bacterium]|nr:hypothetical protein [Clostridia bacterium]